MRILFLSAWFPHPPDNGSKLRISHLLAGLAEKHQVDLVAFCDRVDWQEGAHVLRRYCTDIRVVPWKPFSPYSARALLGFFSPMPRSLVDTYSSQMAQVIREQVRKHPYDLVIASEITMAVYQETFASRPAILEGMELGALSTDAGRGAWNLRRLRLWLTWFKLRHYLARLLPHFRACTVVSAKERELLREAVPHYDNVVIVPNCVDLSSYIAIVAERRKKRLIFPGALTYSANYDAVLFFLKEVFPLILQEEPETSLVLTGRNDGVPWPPFALPNSVHLTGWVEDVRPWIAGSRITIVPLRKGGGTRFKVLESLALGTPVVSTPKGVEGLEVEDGRHFLLAETPRQFAEAVLHLLRDDELWHSLSEQGRLRVYEKYDCSATLPRFLELVETCAR